MFEIEQFKAKLFNIKQSALEAVNSFRRRHITRTMSNPKPEQVSEQGLIFSYFNEINIIAQLSSKLFERSLPQGLTQSQFSVLNWFVRVDSQASPGRLTKAFQVTKGAMTNTLSKLEAKGLIKVQTDALNRRQKVVTMTTKGGQMRKLALQQIAILFDQYKEELSLATLQPQLPGLIKVRAFLDQQRSQTE